LTNDGDLVHALTHPRFHIKKVYQVKVGRRLTSEEITALQEGVYSNGQLLRAGAVRELSTPESSRKQFWYEIDLFEGKNRQLRRMFETLGVLVGRIRRVQFGSVKLGPLRPAEIRPLSEREISALRNSGFRTTK
jgi:23S rRNA pseudouridine2605 synthase